MSARNLLEICSKFPKIYSIKKIDFRLESFLRIDSIKTIQSIAFTKKSHMFFSEVKSRVVYPFWPKNGLVCNSGRKSSISEGASEKTGLRSQRYLNIGVEESSIFFEKHIRWRHFILNIFLFWVNMRRCLWRPWSYCAHLHPTIQLVDVFLAQSRW